MHLFPIPSALFNPFRIPSRILPKGFCTVFMFAQCLQSKQVSQQSGALWGPGRASLFLLFSLLLCPPGNSLFWHLPAQSCPGPAPALILVVWRSAHGSVTLSHSCAFPLPQFNIEICRYLAWEFPRESGFIPSLSSGHFWMHNTWIVASFAWQGGALISDHHYTQQ